MERSDAQTFPSGAPVARSKSAREPTSLVMPWTSMSLGAPPPELNGPLSSPASLPQYTVPSGAVATRVVCTVTAPAGVSVGTKKP